ncbi:glycine betaine/proline transport system permease protein [Kribbella orskensis]|uniref:Glycine betaine/proline transport system permease protein n=1 Tax=Kribbella orskensis TaxID=2512216 RepID=A0ABY2BQ58_9ACTN|nr:MULTISPECIES: ABC transporter permease subunit [Kribbella]TCN39663.1 glycine betaine/proline transport system permease protein [Kribbella sp. VKM Ac-2500]TCO27554.1 glycine betaine/proline transport system permease protein [Kribbella orskensis]
MASITGSVEIRVRRPRRGVIVGVLLVAWVAAWFLLRGVNTLSLGGQETTGLHRWLTEHRDFLGSGNAFFDAIRVAVDQLVILFQAVIAQPSYGRPVPVIGWLGVVALAAYLAWAFGNWKVALLAAAGLTFVGLQGLWQEAMDTLSLTLAAVLLALLIGIPLGIWAGLSNRAFRVATLVLDLMQTLPTFVYLAPLALFFAIGPAAATIATLIYAAPPVVRLTAHAIRSVPSESIEAARSLGSTHGQTLLKVLLPMSRSTVVVGINQTIMAALSMVTVAALIDAPGLGQTVLKALQTLDVGVAFNAGLAIVVLAIVLDRVTTAAGDRPWRTASIRRKVLLGVGGIAVLVAIWFSRTYVWAAEFPSGANLGSRIAVATTDVTNWVQDVFGGFTYGVRDAVTKGVLNPLEGLLTESPWWLVAVVVVTLAALLGSWQGAVPAALCLGLLVATGVWHDAMITLASTLLATVVVVAVGLMLGVWTGRNHRADSWLRPVLDAGQTMPPFVYLVPFLALFGTSRFTAIAAAVVFAVPVTTKIVADGIRAVPVATVEAANSVGSSTWQVISKVQLPVARRAITLAVNQGLIYVLSMVVVGGLVGAGALGYDVAAGFAQSELYGKGLAAGLAIVLLGVMLDRITQAAARRTRKFRGTVRGDNLW